jgi:hypothetical protein
VNAGVDVARRMAAVGTRRFIGLFLLEKGISS